MDRDGLAVVVQLDDLEEPTCAVSADVEVSITLTDDADGIAYGVFDVEVGNTVLAGGSAISTNAGYLARSDWSTVCDANAPSLVTARVTATHR